MFKLEDSPPESPSDNIRIRGTEERKRKGPGMGIKLSTQNL